MTPAEPDWTVPPVVSTVTGPDVPVATTADPLSEVMPPLAVTETAPLVPLLPATMPQQTGNRTG